MQFFQLEPDGSMPDDIREEYGSHFPIWEQLKMGGTGSHKVQLFTGPEDVMSLRNSASDTLQVSFQYLQTSFLIRYNLSQKLYGHIIRYRDILACRWKPVTIDTDNDTWSLELETAYTVFVFIPHPSDYKHFTAYFSKKPLKAVFTGVIPL